MRSLIAAIAGFFLGMIATAVVVVVLALTIFEPTRYPDNEFDGLYEFMVVPSFVTVLSPFGGVLGAFGLVAFVNRKHSA